MHIHRPGVWAAGALLCAAVLSGCSSTALTDPGQTTRPTITLTASPAPFAVTNYQQQDLLLQWNSSNATLVTGASNFSPGVTDTSGNATITGGIDRTTTYSITVSGAGGQATDAVTVFVTGTNPDASRSIYGTWDRSTTSRVRGLLYHTRYLFTQATGGGPSELRISDVNANGTTTVTEDYTAANASFSYSSGILSVTAQGQTQQFAVNNKGRLITLDSLYGWTDSGATLQP